MLLHCTLSPEHLDLVENGVRWLMTHRLPDKNWPSVLGEPGRGLIHFCHGAPGAVFLYAKAFEVLKKQEYLETALEAGELVYRSGVLRKGLGICHGVSGNAYTFLTLYRLTQKELWLERAWQYARLMKLPLKCRTPDNPYSLFEGLAGTVCFLKDLQDPATARFPLYEL
eukprot:GEMP01081482.1.p1 GENE.GEMP01081482.1~~GEMP01081482.1.p1  ORF type:complete len:169 (+),score=22.89 GEMP01081482.1:542-1048(+)